MSNEFNFQNNLSDLSRSNGSTYNHDEAKAYGENIYMIMNRSKKNRDNIFDQPYLQVESNNTGGAVFNMAINETLMNQARVEKPRPKPELKYKGKAKIDEHREAIYDYRNINKNPDIGYYQDQISKKAKDIMSVENSASELVSQREFGLTKNVDDFVGVTNVPNYHDIVSHETGELKFINSLTQQDDRINRRYTTDDLRYDDGKLHINLYNGRQHLTKGEIEESQRNMLKTKDIKERKYMQQLADDHFNGRAKLAMKNANPEAYDAHETTLKRFDISDDTGIELAEDDKDYIYKHSNREQFVANTLEDIDEDMMYGTEASMIEDVDYVDDEQFVKDFDKKVDEITEDDDEEEPKEEIAYGEVTTPTDDEKEILSLEEAIKNAKAAI